MGKAELVDQVKSLQRSGQKQVWWEYCDSKLGGVRDPNKHTEPVLEEFLATVPAAPANGGGGNFGGGGSFAPRVTHDVSFGNQAELVEQVKQLQRSGQKQVWWDYCDARLGGIRDPNKHSAPVLDAFLAQVTVAHGVSHGHSGAEDIGATVVSYGHPGPGWVYVGEPDQIAGYGNAHQGGHGGHGGGHGGQGGRGFGAPPMGGSSDELVDFVKMGQRMSHNFKGAWANYCQAYGGGRNDPAGHDQAHIAGFIDYMGQLGSADLGAAQQMAPQGFGKRQAPRDGFNAQPPPGKRQSFGDGAAFGAGAALGDDKGALVARVKALQRRGPDMKAAWWAICDNHPSQPGVKDPARHDEATLEAFLHEHE